jgi:Fur family peroxide stress response transcriptional regulator
MDDGIRMTKCYEDALRKAGIKVTRQRLEIIREVVHAKGHPSIGEVYDAVRIKMPSISLDTVYRTMRTLAAMGMIHPVGSSGERVRFDADHTPHHHFLCSVCGEAYDFICPEFDTIPIPEQAQALGLVRGTRIEARGVCKKCLEKEREE